MQLLNKPVTMLFSRRHMKENILLLPLYFVFLKMIAKQGDDCLAILCC